MKILHLFYDLMNLYGDYANVLALERTLSEKGADFETEKLSIDDSLEFLKENSAGGYGFIYIGSGTERNQKAALEYLRQFLVPDTEAEGTPPTENLKKALNSKTVMLCTGNSFEMFGRSITDKNGRRYDGIGLFDFETIEGSERIVADIKADFNGNDIIGFINKSSTLEKSGIATPFFKLKQTDDSSKGAGNSDWDRENEGIISGGFYGTHIIGPLLIRNKVMAEYFADLLIQNARCS